MILYHGSNTAVDKVDLNRCRPYKDFGKGFYTTQLKEQAWRMALRTVNIYGGKPCVTAFAIEEKIFQTPGLLKLRIFAKPEQEWALFVIHNRDRNFRGSAGDNNSQGQYDIVAGPVANDDLGLLFDLYTDGIITVAELTKRMEYKKLSDQVSFHTEAAVKYLVKTGCFYE
jgi:hypothetical protein